MNIKKIFNYAFFAFLGIALLYYTYREISLNELVEIGRRAKFQWIALAIGAHWVNHWLRALRWRLLIEVQGYSVSTFHAFIAEMSGFFMNLVPPRIGEWMRCAVLKRLEGVPISKSLGAVVVERFLEVCIFICLFIIGVLLRLSAGESVVSQLPELGINGISSHLFSRIMIFLLAGIILICALFLTIRYTSFFAVGLKKLKIFLKEVGVAIKDARKSNGWKLWGTNIFILLFQFMVEYLSFFAIEEINIGLKGVLFVFLAMNIGMATPTPGGIGVYHVSVITTLMSLGVERKYAIVYATLTHFIQLFNAVVVGGGCSLLSTFYKDRSKQVVKADEKKRG